MSSAETQRSFSLRGFVKSVAGALAVSALTVLAMVGVLRFGPLEIPLGVPFLLALVAAFVCWRSRRVPRFVAIGIVIGFLLFGGFLLMVFIEWSSNPI